MLKVSVIVAFALSLGHGPSRSVGPGAGCATSHARASATKLPKPDPLRNFVTAAPKEIYGFIFTLSVSDQQLVVGQKFEARVTIEEKFEPPNSVWGDRRLVTGATVTGQFIADSAEPTTVEALRSESVGTPGVYRFHPSLLVPAAYGLVLRLQTLAGENVEVELPSVVRVQQGNDRHGAHPH